MFRKVFQSVVKYGKGVLADNIRVSKSKAFKAGQKCKVIENVKGPYFDRTTILQNQRFAKSWLGFFYKDGFPSKAISFALKQRSNNVQRFNFRKFGVSTSLYAFVAFNIDLSDEGTDSTECTGFQNICEIIKDAVTSKGSSQPLEHVEPSQVNVKNLNIGEMISKGSDAAVHKARWKSCEANCVSNTCQDSDQNVCLTTDDDSYDLAVKMMFNYQYESNSDAIERGMQKELLPLQKVVCQKENNFLNNLFRGPSEEVRRRLLPHPNIIQIEEVFVDNVQELEGCHEEYPNSLPHSVNPVGFGRNKTLYIVMKRFPYTLEEYLFHQKEENLQLSVFLFLQLLEGILHLQSSNIAHRDIKSNNILIDFQDGTPRLVITDFGCSFDGKNSLLAHYENDIVDKGGNVALMAPEIACARPGPAQYLDFRKSDLWAAGTVAYEIFGAGNPFYACFIKKCGTGLRNTSYHEDQLPNLPGYVPSYLNKLVKSLLLRNPEKRSDTLVVTNALHLFLWAPEEWLVSLETEREVRAVPTESDVKRWLLLLAWDYNLDRSDSVDHTMKRLFLSRLDISSVMEAVHLLWGID